MNVSQLNDLAGQGKLQGFIPEIMIEDYHAGPGDGSSGIKTLLQKTAAHMKADRENPEKDNRGTITAPTSAKVIGSAVHVAILEAELMDHYVVLRPDETRGGSKAAKDAKEIFLRDNATKYIIDKPEEMEKIYRIRDAVYANSDAAALLSGGVPEQSGYWKDPKTGLLLKLRSDYLRLEDRVSVNLKTAEDASFKGFQKAIMKYGYHWSAAHYEEGFKQITGHEFTEVHMVVEKEPPYGVMIWQIDEGSRDKAREELLPAYEILAACHATGVWPCYPKGVHSISLPHWAFQQE